MDTIEVKKEEPKEVTNVELTSSIEEKIDISTKDDMKEGKSDQKYEKKKVEDPNPQPKPDQDFLKLIAEMNINEKLDKAPKKENPQTS